MIIDIKYQGGSIDKAVAVPIFTDQYFYASPVAAGVGYAERV